MFLIAGAGRSGTTYITAVLQQCGLDVGHHCSGADGIVSWHYTFNARKYPGRHPKVKPAFDVVLHQVRHPLKVIASMQTARSWPWACQFLPVGVDAPLLERCCYYWLVFTEEAERRAALTYRIEALEQAWPELQAILGLDMRYSAATAGISTRTNARPHSAVTWEQVRAAAPAIYPEIRAAAARYGY